MKSAGESGPESASPVIDRQADKRYYYEKEAQETPNRPKFRRLIRGENTEEEGY